MGRTGKRECLPDILKGFAIILVVMGHCIQEGSGIAFKENSLFFQDKLYQFIYSFHMPLFMLISGYFAWYSMEKAHERKEQWRLLGRRSLTLLLPILAWTIFDSFLVLALDGWENPVFRSVFVFCKDFAVRLVSNGWFLWAVFWCFLIVFFMHFYLRDSIILYIAGFLALFVIPDGLGLSAYKFMLPYFISGFYFHRFRKGKLYQEKFLCVKDWMWIVLFGAVFVLLFLFFDEYSMIYLSGYKLYGKDVLRQLRIDCYRTLIGFVGSGFFILVWRKIIKIAENYSFPVLCAFGRNSLGIYMISGEICLFVGLEMRGILFPNHLLNLAETVVVVGMAYVLTVFLEKIPVLRCLVGRQRRKNGGK